MFLLINTYIINYNYWYITRILYRHFSLYIMLYFITAIIVMNYKNENNGLFIDCVIVK